MSVDQATCSHIWIANSGQGGEPRFNIRMTGDLHYVMHVKCCECGNRAVGQSTQAGDGCHVPGCSGYYVADVEPGVACPETVASRFKPPDGCTQKFVAVGVEGRYAGWVLVLHADGENWTTGAKLTDMTFQMLKRRIAGEFDDAPMMDRKSNVGEQK